MSNVMIISLLYQYLLITQRVSCMIAISIIKLKNLICDKLFVNLLTNILLVSIYTREIILLDILSKIKRYFILICLVCVYSPKLLAAIIKLLLSLLIAIEMYLKTKIKSSSDLIEMNLLQKKKISAILLELTHHFYK